MGRLKKDAKYLNVYLHRDVYEDFTKFCETVGQSKSLAAERALVAYMDNFNIKSCASTQDTKKGTD